VELVCAMYGQTHELGPVMSRDAFAALGSNEIAYIKSIRSENAERFFPGFSIAPGLKLFALCAADGSPLMIAANYAAALASANEFRLHPVSVH
jgi:hypothetical protein